MVDVEVQKILREIRERVRAEEEEQRQIKSQSERTHEAAVDTVVASRDQASTAAQPLARIEGYLTTTGRAWDRLPPVVSNRTGTLAKLELWIKQRLKVATRWYAWEQINFNAAVHHALSDMKEVVSSFDQRLQQTAQTFEEVHAELQAQREQLKSLVTLIESQHVVTELHHAQMEALRTESESQTKLRQAQHLELNARVAELAQELSKRDERLLDEQRVCLKQLSLEISEASTLFDRARRQIEYRLDNLEELNRKS